MQVRKRKQVREERGTKQQEIKEAAEATAQRQAEEEEQNRRLREYVAHRERERQAAEEKAKQEAEENAKRQREEAVRRERELMELMERRQALLRQLSNGTPVKANYKGQGQWYVGEISCVHNNTGTVNVKYDDGDQEVGVDVDHVKLLSPDEAAERERKKAPPPPPPPARPQLRQNKSVGLSQGDRCKVYFIKYRRWYPGSVEELRYAKDGTGKYVVAFDDGDRGQYKMDLGQVKPLLTMLPPDGARYTEGQPLQVVLERQWHPCVVVAVNAVSAQKHFKPNGSEAHFGSYKVSRWVGW